MLAGAGIHRVYGVERFGPPLPGTGPVAGVFFYENCIAVVRHHGGHPETTTYVLMDDETEWQRLWVH